MPIEYKTISFGGINVIQPMGDKFRLVQAMALFLETILLKKILITFGYPAGI
jgi:hypothetical protein